jgi:hypothetical protein
MIFDGAHAPVPLHTGAKIAADMHVCAPHDVPAA